MPKVHDKAPGFLVTIAGVKVRKRKVDPAWKVIVKTEMWRAVHKEAEQEAAHKDVGCHGLRRAVALEESRGIARDKGGVHVTGSVLQRFDTYP